MSLSNVPETDGDGATVVAAILRDNGHVYFEMTGKQSRARGEPDRVSQIALTTSGLSCLDSRGSLYHLQRERDGYRWICDPTIDHVASIGCLSSSRLCAITTTGTAYVHHRAYESFEESKPSTWKEDEELAQWIGATPPSVIH